MSDLNYCLGKEWFCCIHHPRFKPPVPFTHLDSCSCEECVNPNLARCEWHGNMHLSCHVECPCSCKPPQATEKCECDHLKTLGCTVGSTTPDQAVEEKIKEITRKITSWAESYLADHLRELVSLAQSAGRKVE